MGMKVSVTVMVEIDPRAWMTTFGVERSEVRQDVKEYVRDAVANLRVWEEVTPKP